MSEDEDFNGVAEISRTDPDQTTVPNGTVSSIRGTPCVYFDGYWIRKYEVPADQDAARLELIDGLTKRVFHHTEPGINTPGYKLESARAAYERESEPERKRVNAAMLAGALLNRGSDIFGMIFRMKQKGIEITEQNELLLECESCFLEALDLGRQVRHYSGEEGLDELWGEPLKVFSTPIAQYYESRYIKIAQTMAAIDEIARKLGDVLAMSPTFEQAEPLLRGYAIAAKHEIETMKTDPAIFQVWPEFVATGNELWRFQADTGGSGLGDELVRDGNRLIREGKNLMEWIAFARIPMPATTANFVRNCDTFITKADPEIAA
ncbi:MAG: hypothetical protein ACU85U_13080 [Gammaproteobacteria bacterium]|jgi:hypothetical protein